jgi:prepilin-type N-terminal cleavage/methylation domain-containing protein
MYHQARILNGKKAFTLIEVLVVISIIVFLISIVTLSGSRARARARDARRVADINTIRDALVLHLSLYGFYPDLEPCKYNISTAQDTYCPQSTNWLQVLVDRKLLSAVPRDPINAADIPLGMRLVKPVYAGPIIEPPTAIPTPTTTPTPTATGSPSPSPTPNQTPDGTPTITPTPTVTPTASPTAGASPTPSPTGAVTPAPGASGRQYAIYSRLWPPIATFMSQNEAQMILCASKMEVDQRETLENGYPNATVASFLISIGYNPAARCLLIT